jgi:hypothetical protein
VQTVEHYPADGRKFAGLDDDALRERFVLAFEAWVATDHPDIGRTLNAVSAEFLLRRKPAPIERIADKVVKVFEGYGGDPPKSLDREPVTVIALGRWLFAPFMGSLLLADRDDDDERAAVSRDFRSIVAAARGGAQ